MKPKLIAFYLPQFHPIPENDKWWGKGFTEWVNVKKSKPNYRGHYQPTIPLNKNYYSLLDSSVQEWQAQLAQKYGIYGFCYYHYWFDGKLLLEKPMENMLNNPNVNIPFCVCWANESWTRTWIGDEKQILIKQNYDADSEQITKHFEYLLPFFRDARYIKKENKPVVIIYKPYLIKNLEQLMSIWNDLAIINGFDGIFWGHQSCESFNYDTKSFDFGIEFEPFYTRYYEAQQLSAKYSKIRRIPYYLTHPKKLINKLKEKYGYGWIEDYTQLVKSSINRNINNHNYLGVFPSWDNTPRRGKKSYMVKNSTPQLFEKYLKYIIKKNSKKADGEFIFINAWNEWAEGAYLEPDERYKYAYLEAVKNALHSK